jgi:O-antigen/teichoic acid export membrane protein
MKNIIILIGSRLINGVFGLLLFLFLKKVIDNNGYDLFSSNYANLTLVSTFAGGVLGGLLLKNAFHFGTKHHQLVYIYTLFFGLLMIIPIELAFYFNVFRQLSHLTVYSFMLSHLLCAVVLVHFQLMQAFIKMASIEISRTLLPLIVVAISFKTLTVNEVIWLLTLGNVFGIFYFIRLLVLTHEAQEMSIIQYFKTKLRSDLAFGFSFGSFNAVAQSVIASDRGLIVSQATTQGANIAYTADQLTKATNGILFPLNTKVSSELGGLVRRHEIRQFHRKLYIYTWITLLAGLGLTLPIYVFVWLYGDFKLVNDLNKQAILYYGLANTVYLSCLVYQKRFDYTKYKLLPTVLLLTAAAMAFVGIQFFATISYFFLTAMFFGIFLIASGFILPNASLELDK